MYYNGIIKKVRKELKNYSSYNKVIEELEFYKNYNPNRDVNSFIRSKNRINRIVEINAIKNISIDEQIKEIRAWQNVINFAIENVKQYDQLRYNIIIYKFVYNMSEECIEERVYLARASIRKYLDEFIIETAFIAIKEGLIKLENL